VNLLARVFGGDDDDMRTTTISCWAVSDEHTEVSEALPWIEREQTEATETMSLGSREVDGGFGDWEIE
jgi:hypothetical protein